MKTGVPCNENRFFPVGIDLQGFPVSFTGFGFAVWSPTATHKHNLILGKMIFEVRSHVCKLPDDYVLGIMISIEQ